MSSGYDPQAQLLERELRRRDALAERTLRFGLGLGAVSLAEIAYFALAALYWGMPLADGKTMTPSGVAVSAFVLFLLALSAYIWATLRLYRDHPRDRFNEERDGLDLTPQRRE